MIIAFSEEKKNKYTAFYYAIILNRNLILFLFKEK